MDNNENIDSIERKKFPYRCITPKLSDALEHGDPEEPDKSLNFPLDSDTKDAAIWYKGRIDRSGR